MYDNIVSVHRKFKANAASVHSTLGGGQHGLLGMTLSPETYTTVTGHQFEAPENPRVLPIIPLNNTNAQIKQIVRQHKDNLRVWKEYNAVELVLKQQLIGAFDEVHFKGLYNRHVAVIRAISKWSNTYTPIMAKSHQPT